MSGAPPCIDGVSARNPDRGPGGPDRLAAGVDGRLAVAQVGMGGASRFSALGELQLQVRSNAGLATIDFGCGGAGERSLHRVESASAPMLRAAVGRPRRSIDADA